MDYQKRVGGGSIRCEEMADQSTEPSTRLSIIPEHQHSSMNQSSSSSSGSNSSLEDSQPNETSIAQESCKIKVNESHQHQHTDKLTDQKRAIHRLVLVNRLLGILVVFGVLIFTVMFALSYMAIIGCSANHSVSDRIKDLPRAILGRFLQPSAELDQANTTTIIQLCGDRYVFEFDNQSLKTMTIQGLMVIIPIAPPSNTTNAAMFAKSPSDRPFVRFPVVHQHPSINFAVDDYRQLASVRIKSRLECEGCDGAEATSLFVLDTNQCRGRSVVVDHWTDVRRWDNREFAGCKDDDFDKINGIWFMGNFEADKNSSANGFRRIGRIIVNTRFDVEFYSNGKTPLPIKSDRAVKIDSYMKRLRDCSEILMNDDNAGDENDQNVMDGGVFSIHDQYIISN